MAVSQISILNGKFSHLPSDKAILRDGSSVQARVIAEKSPGSYQLSIAGKIIDVRSQTKLLPGSLISARVKINGKQIELALIKDNDSSVNTVLQKFNANGKELQPQLRNFLISLGFEPEAESFKILQFMQQIGMKINVSAAKKALLKAKYKGQVDEEKAQIVLLMEEKGLNPDEKAISSILGKDRQKGQNNENKNENPAELYSPGERIGKIKKSVKNYFDSLKIAAENQDTGPLSAFNSIISSDKKNIPVRHWLIFPFEWNFSDYQGQIKLLFDSSINHIEKIIINLKNADKESLFVLYFTGSSLSQVKFASTRAEDTGNFSLLEKMLQSVLKKNIKVSSAKFDELKGFCSSDEEMSTVSGEF